jgi:phosphohistidine phosphatase|tara:strand:+ start:2049 stop:2312 length:264 start_codon:yes stop_codon:yes gene_type:complete
LLGFTRAVNDRFRSAMIVGHNPGMAAFASKLAKSGDKEAIDRLKGKFPTAALAIFDNPQNQWSKLIFNETRLIEYIRPKDLQLLNNC